MAKPNLQRTIDRKAIQDIANFFAIIGDTVMIVVGLFFAFWFRFKSGLIPLNESWWTSGGSFQDRPISEYFGIIGVGALLLVLTLVQMGMYRAENLLRFRRVLLIIFRGVAAWMLIYFSVSLVLKFSPQISRIYILSSSISVLVIVCGWRWVYCNTVLGNRISSNLRQRLVFVGWSKESDRLSKAIIGDKNQPYNIVGYVPFFSEEHVRPSGSEVQTIGTFSELEILIHEHSIDTLVLADLGRHQKEAVEAINLGARLMVKVKIISSVFDVLVAGLRLETISSVPILGVSELPLDRVGNRVLKRAVDILGSVVGLISGFPIFILFGALIFWESPGPIFFRQERVGRGGRKFNMIKLRSMRLDADKLDHLNQSTLRDDPRMLRIGAFIRKWNLDEVPQFFNVLMGQMSLVGPRPERTFHSESLSYQIPQYNSRLMCKPGITGWAQVNGLRGDTDLAERVRLDLYYLENWSIWLDVQIMVQTFISRKNAY